MTDKVVKRGYVKWEDEGGFHKELLYKHPDLLAKASPDEQLQAEEARRAEEEAKAFVDVNAVDHDKQVEETLEALKAAPSEIVFASDLPENDDSHGD